MCTGKNLTQALEDERRMERERPDIFRKWRSARGTRQLINA
jgi:hypothetical protein